MHVPQLLVLFVLGPNVDDNGVNPLSDQALDTLQSQLQKTVPVLWERQQKVFWWYVYSGYYNTLILKAAFQILS